MLFQNVSHFLKEFCSYMLFQNVTHVMAWIPIEKVADFANEWMYGKSLIFTHLSVRKECLLHRAQYGLLE